MRTEGSHKAMAFSVVIFMLFGSYFIFSAALFGQPDNQPLIQTVSAGEKDK